jgi:glycosyltransferase involved in cell wall biosynthesis
VVVSTIGRFHSFDLARQMQRFDSLTCIVSGYPRFKLRETGVDPARIRCFPWLQTPYMALIRSRLFRRHLARAWERQAHLWHDRHVAAKLPDCDLVTALSGCGLRTGRAAVSRGVVYVCDRGSSHIQTQDRLLREEHARLGLPWGGVAPWVIAAQLAEYELADAITVPSSFVRDSFIAEGVTPDKLILAPYGVEPAAFRRVGPCDPEFRVLFVGQLAVRKGLHTLLQAMAVARLPRARLVLVGGAQEHTDLLLKRFPLARLECLGHLPRSGVIAEMSRASVLVLPSVEEGLALVQAQAMACGCPVIATPHTGAADLFSDGVEGFIVPIRDPLTLADRLERLYHDPELRERMGRASLARVTALGGWNRYGEILHRASTALVERKR